MNRYQLNIPLLLLVTVVVSCLSFIGFTRLRIDTDIVRSLPGKEPVITDALTIFHKHPIHDQVAVDIAIDRPAPDTLIECSRWLRERMAASGLFAEVGMDDVGALLPDLAQQVVLDLPMLFSGKQLEEQVVPMLEPEAIRRRLQAQMQALSGLEGVGQAGFLGLDPLGLRELVLARLIHLAPTSHASFYRGQLLSEDGRHLLLVARPKAAGSDSANARLLADFFADAGDELARSAAASGHAIEITPVGAYRAALDNEEIIRHDVSLALGVSTLGIGLLMLFAFPRPLVGLLTLVPAMAGLGCGLFLYSLFHDSISIMVLGFSGALISVMDDHSITYLLFLDRPHATNGEHTAREVQGIGGLTAILTTIGAFLVLSLSDFPVFNELGQFTALSFASTYLFIHWVLPRLIPAMPPAGERQPLLQGVAVRLFETGWYGATVALVLALGLLAFARPEFRISLADMNTVSAKTRAEDNRFTAIWGDLGGKIQLMVKAASPEELRQRNDRLAAMVTADLQEGRLASAFVPAMVFPGEELGRNNLAAWREFWTGARITRLQSDLVREGTALRFAGDAFAGFLAQLAPKQARPVPTLPPGYHKLLGIAQGQDGHLIQFLTLTPGKAYDPAALRARYGAEGAFFDPAYFSTRLGEILFATFSTLFAVIAVMVAVLLFLQFLSWRLTLITLAPLVFAFVCTLGTLRLLGHPLDIPGLMLTVVILGLGTDYAIYLVCAGQRYGTIHQSSHRLLRGAVLLSAASTLIGFGVLCFAEHATLRSVGITSLCGIGYSLLGAFLLLPPLLERHFTREEARPASDDSLEARIMHRYRLLEAYPRMFVRCKLRYDPLFAELAIRLAEVGGSATILDVGCGHGVPACWCLEVFPEARVIGIDPDSDRVRVAARAAGDRGLILEGAAPELAAVTGPVEVVLLLDMLHYLDDAQLAAALRRCRALLVPGGLLLLRFVIRPTGRRSWYWYVEDLRVRWGGGRAWYRSCEEMMNVASSAGFGGLTLAESGNRELYWLTGNALEEVEH